jgi:hypothetical protein
LELGNKDGLQRSYGNQAGILKACGRLQEAFALHKKEAGLNMSRERDAVRAELEKTAADRAT